MNTPIYSKGSYNIADTALFAGRNVSTDDFFVVEKEEMPNHEKMFLPVRSRHFTVYLQTSGSVEIKANLSPYSLSDKCLLIMRPEVVRQKVSETEDSKGIKFGFTHDFFEKSMVHKKHANSFSFFSLQGNPLISLTDEEASALTSIMLGLKKASRNNEHPFKEEIMHHGFNLFMCDLAAIARKYRSNEEQTSTRKEDILLRFLKLLSKHFKTERSVKFYADSLYISAKHLTKTIKELTTKTCSEFIDDMVIAEAKILLDNHSLSIGQVGDELHFSDQFFFSKFFKNHSGLSPSRYRNLA